MPPASRTPAAADGLADLAGAAVAADPELQARLRNLTHALIDDAFHTLRFGSPSDRAVLMKSIVPAMLKSMQGTQAAESERAVRESYERLMREIRGETETPQGDVP